VIQEEDLLRILKLPVLVVLDEAYIEFSDEPSRAGWVREYSNLIVLRTFSKRAGESTTILRQILKVQRWIALVQHLGPLDVSTKQLENDDSPNQRFRPPKKDCLLLCTKNQPFPESNIRGNFSTDAG
jgi:hypothetical protein